MKFPRTYKKVASRKVAFLCELTGVFIWKFLLFENYIRKNRVTVPSKKSITVSSFIN